MNEKSNRCWLLINRPISEPSEDDFEIRENPIPDLGKNQFLVKIIYLSVDPYMRGRMRDGASYAPPAALDEVMVGGAVGQIIKSNNDSYSEGKIVQGNFGWQEYAVSDGVGVNVVDTSLAPISTSLGVLGMPGLTAYFGLLEVGRPVLGETIVISAAAGAVGSVVGQIAKIKGCNVVGIAGGSEKCRYLEEELGFDYTIDYKSQLNISNALDSTCPKGIDIYFDNVGGAILDEVLNHINLGARIPICGMISEYNLSEPQLVPRPTRALLVNRARMQGLLVWDWVERRQEGIEQMARWIKEGKLHYKEDILEGIDKAPEAFLKLFKGQNFGKQIIKVGDLQ
ncbi:MAG: NADP-dependent oxidoreductase [Alphaproteobacteria bacterium]|jgi:NADPH-dependent curcumin reductase CurA|nr:NADP-dependent oxidoreductase [Alphaproteobacteria bacterium]PPR14258.1 MAG: putative NADP-dependent oxidoreductase YfmJ [Alphaproteobacteria bacterium MarineAlpha12_Bin1]|tara:strand:- start:1204 stop:2223 length:1020 start_codon:yes stop_codon:yes gene_type:complete